MVTKLRARISVGLQLTLAFPEENPDLWTQVLLQGHPEDLGVETSTVQYHTNHF